MGTNVEIKARLHDPPRQRRLAAAHTASRATTLVQHDTFFESRTGRLKLRQLAADQGELIHYERADTTGPKSSEYAIVRTTEPDGLRALLTAALGVLGEVHKTRTLLLVGQTRIHLDRVDGLGEFLELEVVLEPGQAVEEGERIAQQLMAALEVRDEDLVEGAYVDLLRAAAAAPLARSHS